MTKKQYRRKNVTNGWSYKALPEEDRFCLFCDREPLVRTSQGTHRPGVRTWRCPACDRVYSDVRMYQDHADRGPTGPKEAA